MPIIRSHDITIYGNEVILRPLEDRHLPLLYKWNSDPEVLYWTEGGAERELSYDGATVDRIYGGVSQNALCFIVELDGAFIGECWLQRMNLPYVIGMYPPGLDVRRIDMMIGEKALWGRGYGTDMVRALVAYAFAGERVDVLHCFSEDYNKRSCRVWEKNGFALALEEDLPQPQKGQKQYHWRLTRDQFIARRRVTPPPDAVFMSPVDTLRPSQLYISAGKLAMCREWFDGDAKHMDAIPVKRFMGGLLMTDGHTRAAMAYMAGARELPCYIDGDALDMAAYAADIAMCRAEGVAGIAELARRVVPARDYEALWHKRCFDMYGERLYKTLVEGDEKLFWRERTVRELDPERDIRPADDVGEFNRHLALCGQAPLSEDAWRAIAGEGARYYCLYEEGKPVARACVERYSEAFWELADVRVAREYRARGLGIAVCARVTNLIVAEGRTATCRTLPENAPMLALLASLGYARLYEPT